MIAAVLRGAGRSLVRGSTYLRWVYLLLGAALVLAFLLVDSALIATVQDLGLPKPLGIALALVLVALPPLAVGLLPAVREVEAVAVESLLAVRFAERPLGPARNWSQRRRSAAWFLIHLLSGGVVGFSSTIGIPLGLLLIAAPFREPGERTLLPDITYHVDGDWSDAWLPLAGVLCVVLPLVLASVVGALLVRWAPAVLGPTASERIELLERRTTTLVERNRLARELHDSVGHALSLVTLQAGAARKVLDTDPEFARTALAAMEESARAALTDLDHVLGLLREDRASTLPQLTLADVPRLVEATRAGGITVETDVDGGLDAVPAAVSREAYRIVQEGLTNAVRHAGLEPAELTVGLTIGTGPGTLRLELTNPVGTVRRTRPGRVGRGLAGIRERVAVLRGTVEAGADDGTWRLAVTLPTGLDPKRRKDEP